MTRIKTWHRFAGIRLRILLGLMLCVLPCAANPANSTDPSGTIVIADEWCQNGILDGFSEEEILFIQFDKNGVLNADLLDLCPSNSSNFADLRALAHSEYKIIAQGATEVEKKEGIYIMGDDFDSHNKGETLMPNIEGAESPDNDVHVYTSIHLSEMKRATNLAHELYGHAIFFLEGKDSTHPMKNGYEQDDDGQWVITLTRTNEPLENKIKASVTEARGNYLKRKHILP